MKLGISAFAWTGHFETEDGGLVVFIFSGIEPSPSQVQAMQTAGQYTSFLHRETMRVITPYLELGPGAPFNNGQATLL